MRKSHFSVNNESACMRGIGVIISVNDDVEDSNDNDAGNGRVTITPCGAYSSGCFPLQGNTLTED